MPEPRSPLAVLVLVLVLVLPARAQEPSLERIADAEALAQQVERDGLKRVPLEPVVPGKIPDSLVFRAQGNTVEREKEFREDWIAAYKAVAEGVETEAVAAIKAGSRGAGAAGKLLQAITPRLKEVRALAKQPREKETFAAREEALRRFLKRYDLGPRVAKASAEGTAVIHVSIAPSIYDVVKKTIASWKATPLKDPRGGDVRFGARRVEYADVLAQSELRQALQMLQGEVFIVRYARWEAEKETELIRVTGAKLLLGQYYFVEHGDRMIVAREPGAGR